ncbi:hypothetical protein [Helicobacter sp. 11S02629-2]|uniref:hypothetical protein n=1 Tax=Helicobacter sp. 11S02629-2 TaxID=1476195 RepID=UPI0015DAD20E|nr:hypothetical protein [Helicobacter sp. 11S02629-2]
MASCLGRVNLLSSFFQLSCGSKPLFLERNKQAVESRMRKHWDIESKNQIL